MASMAVRVNDSDRLTFTVFLALALHAIVVLGITFKPQDPRPAAQTLDITLSHTDDRQAPEHPDFLAQTNQKGSGTRKEKAQITTTRVAPLLDDRIHKIEPLQQAAAQARPQPAVRHEVTTTSRSEQVAPSKTPKVAEDQPAAPVARKSLMQRALEIASLEARLDTEQRDYARRPRVMRVTAASTLKSNDAAYVQSWVNKVTRVGNLNYPDEARRRGVHGTLRLLVALWSNGTIKDVQVLESSGHKVLDQAAIRIVKLSAPFAPFPSELRKKKDVLEIIRTWSFEPEGMSSR